MEKGKYLFIALGILLGLALNGYLIGEALKRFKNEDRYINVKGFSEREVKADFAVWTLKTRITSNDLLEGSREVEENKKKIIRFLQDNGINNSQIIQQDLNVEDLYAREYGDGFARTYRYIIVNTLQVRSEEIEKVQKVSRMTDELLKNGIVVSSMADYRPAVQYLFTKLNDIKPAMLSEATQNARAAAMEFAKESNVTLGSLRKANQGLFSIVDRDAYISGQAGEGGYYGSNTSDIFKKVRVVIHVEYAIR